MSTPIGPGSVVASRYEVLSPLGAGGMGMVFRAYDRRLEEEVALKVLRAGADEDLVRRFRSEVRLARKVRHKHVCAIHDYDEDGELFYISMELVRGTDLRRLLQERGALEWEQAYDFALQAGAGLAAVHEAGVIHRDLKPANIMLDEAGVVRVMDFGIAKLGGEGTPGLTGEGRLVGSPEYMSPEQGRTAAVDFRTDLYSFGVVIYELFTGHVPFRGDTPIATILKHQTEEPPLEGPEALTIPPSLVPVLRRALAKSPADRYPTCAAMLDDLGRARAALSREITDEMGGGSSGGRSPRLVPGLRRVAYPPEVRLLVPTLVRALRHPQASVRRGAAAALRETPDGSARTGLLEALADTDLDVRAQAAEALRRIDEESSPGPAMPRVEPAPTASADQAPTAPAVAGSEPPAPGPGGPAPEVIPPRDVGRGPGPVGIVAVLLAAAGVGLLTWTARRPESPSPPRPSPTIDASSTTPDPPALPRPGEPTRPGDPEVSPPVCQACPPPAYPPIALRLKRQGTVVLRMLVDEEGRVAEVMVVKDAEHLTAAAVAAASRWTYRPPRKRGVPVKAWIEVPVHFELPR